jgi:hypothetical protein
MNEPPPCADPKLTSEWRRDNDLAARRWVEAERAYNAALKAPLSEGPTMGCPTCAERGYDNTDYHRLHRAWCDSVAEIERLRAVLEEFARQKTEDEMSEEEYDMADVWGAYETFIARSRAALASRASSS